MGKQNNFCYKCICKDETIFRKAAYSFQLTNRVPDENFNLAVK